MSDFRHNNTGSLSEDDWNTVEQIVAAYLQPGESVLEVRAIGADKLEINVGLIIHKKSGSGRKVVVEKASGAWTVTGVQGWIA